ncbi:universal stress protein [Mycolicibacterium monacense]|uniref:Universal stress protein n=4 Tax=Mycobacteriaceae TaxID=1762 RepID=A0AAD1J1K3_MYCMB|nr:universal stress protein [Mycolicibacterium monacense]MDA4101892.1 universal stress protein [Mycolicibacterium monacense DSM 44395]OBB65401.1 universal stress protein [Mycolicibacterium monacense]OBF55797.1 universal stress protein [Mycolicibacterium monacense]ORB15525.1 universal stress protein [Mycolicibacterium monacense DSM 44395]QHP84830.1 universal stress protein [Mycolicibacterium monacense DSM 44395]
MPLGVLIGFDGSPAATAAIEVGGQLLPQAHAWVAQLWTPPFASEPLRRRLRSTVGSASELVERTEREGEREAQRIAVTGTTLARAAGLDAEPLVKRTWGGEGLVLAQLAEQVSADLLLVGSRGLGGAQALMGSVSDMAVHYASRPTLVAPAPMLADEYDALAGGPVVVGWDGSGGARTALSAAQHLFHGREIVAVSVGQGITETPPDGVATEHIDTQAGAKDHFVADTLTGLAAHRRAAAIVVGSRGQSAIREVLLGSVARATLRSAHRPVLVVPGP